MQVNLLWTVWQDCAVFMEIETELVHVDIDDLLGFT